MSDFDDWLRSGSADPRNRIAEGDRDSFDAWLRHKPPHNDPQDDALSQRLTQHIEQVNRAAAEAMERALHGPKRPPTTQE